MLHLNSKKSPLNIAVLCAGLITIVELHGYVSSLDKYDPFPVFSARDPQGFLLDRKKLNAEGTDWWHWVGDTWFLSDSSGKFTAQDIRDKVKKIVPNERFVVVEINENGDTWSGVTVNDPEKKMFSWFRSYWKK